MFFKIVDMKLYGWFKNILAVKCFPLAGRGLM